MSVFNFHEPATIKDIGQIGNYLNAWVAQDKALSAFSCKEGKNLDHGTLIVKLHSLAIQIIQAVATHTYTQMKNPDGSRVKTFCLKVEGKTDEGKAFTLTSNLHRTTRDDGKTWLRPTLPPSFVLGIQNPGFKTINILILDNVSTIEQKDCCIL